MKHTNKEAEQRRATLLALLLSLAMILTSFASVFAEVDVQALTDNRDVSAGLSDAEKLEAYFDAAAASAADAERSAEEALGDENISDDAENANTKAAAKVKYTTDTSISLSGYEMNFLQPVIKDKYMPKKKPSLAMTLTGNKKSITLKWKASGDTSAVLGYYVLRKNLTDEIWTQVADIPAGTKTYTDAEASVKNQTYNYLVVAYTDVDGFRKVSRPSNAVSGVTSKSKSKNLTSVSLTNLASVSAMMEGVQTKADVDYPKKTLDKSLYWWSTNKAVATVDQSGTITGVAAGKATVKARTHAGNITSFPVVIVKKGTAQAMIDVMTSWEGYSYYNGKHKGIVDIYNSKTPLPVGYKASYWDAWCDISISAAAIRAGCAGKTGRECGVGRHIDIFKKKKIWIEDGTVTPQPGDLIVYSWYKWRQPNNSSASHIGIVEKVENGTVYTLEGNMGAGKLSRREIPVGWGAIRGYARPKYVQEDTQTENNQ